MVAHSHRHRGHRTTGNDREIFFGGVALFIVALLVAVVLYWIVVAPIP
jgi:hypothetical protein